MSIEKKWMLSLIDPFFQIDETDFTPDIIEIPNPEKSKSTVKTRYQTLKSSYSIQTYKVLSSSFSFFHDNIEQEKWNSLGKEFVMAYAMKEPQLGLIVNHFYKYCLNKNLPPENLLNLNKDWAYIKSKRSKFIKSSCVTNISMLQKDNFLSFQQSVSVVASETLVVSRDQNEIYENSVSKTQLKILLDFKEKSFKLIEIAEVLKDKQKIADFITKAINGRWLFTHN